LSRRCGQRSERWVAALLAVVVIAHAAHGEVAEEQIEEALYAAPTRLDRVGRVLAPVHINGHGPFRFVIDTGANRSAVSAALAERLGLATEGQALIGVHGMIGYAELPAVHVARLSAGNIEMLDLRLPVLPRAVFAGADGILGVEGLQGTRIEADFERDRVTIERSRHKRAPKGYLTVPARIEHNGLLVVNGRVGRTRVRVLIDTGAERSIGNLRLQDALARTVRRQDWTESIVTGATPGSVVAPAFQTPTISIGDVRLQGLAVTFGDLHVFKVWGLTEEPALLVGMDVLGTVERLVVDYGRREFQMKPRGSHEAPLEMCSNTGCGSRLPGSR
jgi:predicted aspartyl protease